MRFQFRINSSIYALIVSSIGFVCAGCRAKAPDSTPQPKASPEASAAQAIYALTDVTAESGINFVHQRGAQGDYLFPELIGSGAAFLDYDNDGDLDIYLVQGGEVVGEDSAHRNALFRNDGAGFVDVSVESRSDLPGFGMGCAAADVDNDGDTDLFVTRLGANALLRNNGDGTFDDVATSAGVADPGFGVSAAFVDYDRDGLLDLYVVNYVVWSRAIEHTCYGPDGLRDYCGPVEYPSSADRLYRNLGGGRFEDVSDASGIGRIARDGLGIGCADLDNDGWIDIYVANDQMAALCWINQRDGTFKDDAAIRGCAVNEQGVAIAGMGVAMEDIDGNGFVDLLVTNIAAQTHLFFTNTGGYFEDRTRRHGLSNWNIMETGFGVAWIDIDNDSRSELLIANGAVGRSLSAQDPEEPYGQRNQLARRVDDLRFEMFDTSSIPAFQSIRISRGLLRGDYDNDGDIDVLITNNGAAPQLLRNDSAGRNAWACLTLRDDSVQRDALNARIEIVANGTSQFGEVRPHSGYLSSNDPRVHFGLGSAKHIDRAIVTWPGGGKQEFKDLAINQFHVLRKAKSSE